MTNSNYFDNMKNSTIRFLLFSIFLTVQLHVSGQDKRHRTEERRVVQEGYNIGDKIEDFQLKNVNNELFSLSSIKNSNGYIIIFTSNTCPYAVAYEDRMIDLHKKMVELGYPVIAINSNNPAIEPGDSFEEMIKKSKELDFPYPYIKDENKVYKKFGANKTPQVFLVDNDMVLQYSGAIDDNAKDPKAVTINYVENAIASLNQGKNPDPSKTKAIGCSIKVENNRARGKRPQGPPNPKDLMSRMDANEDNKLSKEEVKGPLARDFDNLDSNKDGVLTIEELSKTKGRKRRS